MNPVKSRRPAANGAPESKRYDPDTARRLCNECERELGEGTLYQTADGEFFVHELEVCLDGRMLSHEEDQAETFAKAGVDVRKSAQHPRVSYTDLIRPMTQREAAEWCIVTQIPEPLRGDVHRLFRCGASFIGSFEEGIQKLQARNAARAARKGGAR